MKKLLVLSAAILFAFTMNAQKFGVKAGYNMSGYLINFYSPDGSKMSTGFNFGLVGEMPVNDMMSLRADVTFNQLGSDYDSKDETDANWPYRALGMEYKYNQNINYLQIGISPKFSFGPAYAFVGPYFAYALSASQKGTWEGTSPVGYPVAGTGTVDLFSDPKIYNPAEAYSDTNNAGGTGDLINKMDVGLNLGVGADFSGVFVELNAGMGLLNFINTGSTYYSATNYATKDDKTVAITGDASQKNIYFGLSVGYLLGGK
ncbi:MAG: PorT family protein [Bacteroidales bacterium]|nr:PorT family protein [Bacteroidales bacterium]